VGDRAVGGYAQQALDPQSTINRAKCAAVLLGQEAVTLNSEGLTRQSLVAQAKLG
jgi:hypothetical protein